MRIFSLLSVLSLCHVAFAATADQWRTRSIYQLIVDRYALPKGAPTNACNPGDQTWCGGTWNSIRENLDYIQDAGFTAVWISPVNQNWLGPRTPYGDPYHGYWIQDASKLNDRFGTSDDLKALSAEVHRRGMYLMIDVVVNNVVATSITPDYSVYMFKQASQYHPYCSVSWGNHTSEERCWLGDHKVTLPDLNTEDPTVQSTYGDWIKALVQEYNIDGLRIDAAKHVNGNFWGPFCQEAGVFCMGEVDEADVNFASQFQGSETLDSILNYPMYHALVDAFTLPGPTNVTALSITHTNMRAKFKDLTVLGNFLENQDNPRWTNISVDPQTLFNAMVWTFMYDGIPIVYYGQEQFYKGNADPWNREPLWTSGYTKSSAYKFITCLNKFRNFLVNTSNTWATSRTQILTTSPQGIAIMKGSVISIMTTAGSPPKNASLAVYTPFKSDFPATDVLSCRQWVVGSNGTVEVEYSLGGRAVILIPSSLLSNSNICSDGVTTILTTGNGAPSLQIEMVVCTSLIFSLALFFLF